MQHHSIVHIRKLLMQLTVIDALNFSLFYF